MPVLAVCCFFCLRGLILSWCIDVMWCVFDVMSLCSHGVFLCFCVYEFYACRSVAVVCIAVNIVTVLF